MEDFNISQEETGFPLVKYGNFASFAPVNKLTRLAYLRGAYLRRNSFLVRHIAYVRKVFIMLEIQIYFLQKCMVSLQEAFIHPLEPCEARFIEDGCTLFDFFWTVEK